MSTPNGSIGLSAKIDTKEVQKKLNDTDRLGDAAESYVERLTITLKNIVTRYSPVKTGSLKASWNSAVESQGRNYIGAVGTNIFYARFLEFSQPPKQPKKPHGVDEKIPFLKPALEFVTKNIDKFNDQLKKDIEGNYKRP
tara:strand:+ start:290 stop:709 length:420 start_codon:yes stop_codon:yes gene_type:complete